MITALGKKLFGSGYPSSTAYPPIPSPVGVTDTSKAYIEAKDYTGTSYYVPLKVSQISRELATTGELSYNGCVAVGSDDTPATENDYTLGNVITGLSASKSESTVIDETNEKYVYRIQYTISNNTGSDVTIKEIGYFVGIQAASTKGDTPSSGWQNRKTFLTERTVLDTPLVIPNGEASILRYEFAY